MTENQFNRFSELKENVLLQLKDQNYLDSTLINYRRFYNRIERFMEYQSVEKYSESVGKAFLLQCHHEKELSHTAKNAHRCAIRRLDDFINDKPYICHHDCQRVNVSVCYKPLLDRYLKHCIEKGNKPGTLIPKQKNCTEFLNYIEALGCKRISCLTVEMVTKACLIFENKDAYAIIRQFLEFLAAEKFTCADLSGIVPHYKRRKTIPTTYTMSEISKIETSVNQSTDLGKRDTAIILLATRLGLRSGDIAALKFNEVDFQAGYINIIQEKTGDFLSLQMPEDVSKSLATHIENVIRLRYTDGYVFHSFSAPYGRITTSIIRHTVTNHIHMAGIDIKGRKHGPHAFRSSFASSMVNDDIPYETVRKILGHRDPDAIKHYAKADIERLRFCAIEAPTPQGIFHDYLCGRRSL